MPAAEEVKTPERPGPYSLRARRYQYSHTMAPRPVVAPPPRNTKRPPVPPSAARKRKGKTVDTPIADSQEVVHPASAEPQPNDSASGDLPVGQPGPDTAPNTEGNDGHTISHRTLSPVIEEQGPNTSDQQDDSLGLHNTGSDPEIPVTNAAVTSIPSPKMTPLRNPDIQVVHPTPDRSNSRGVGSWGSSAPGVLSAANSHNSPLAFRVGVPPPWVVDFSSLDDDEEILNPRYHPNPTLPMAFPPGSQNLGDTVTLSQLVLPNPSHTAGFPPSNQTYATSESAQPTPSTTSDTFPSYSIFNDNPQRSFSPPLSDLENGANTLSQHQSQPATHQPIADDLLKLHGIVVQSLRPAPFPVFARSVSPAEPPPPTGIDSESAQAMYDRSRSCPAISRGPSPIPTEQREQSPITLPLATPSTVPSRSTTPGNDSAHGPSQRKVTKAARELSRGSFTKSQYKFIEAMTRRWQWFILTEYAFPVGTAGVAETCMTYAETVLGISRKEESIGPAEWEYVRAKEFRVRHDAQRGVLATVEDKYFVTKDDKPKIDELIEQNNFIFTSYDPSNLKKVAGRYKHPCIGEVMKMIMFPPVTRQQPIGARFIRELIAITPAHMLVGLTDKKANYGAPIQLIALACTVILYCFHLLEQGHTSKDPKSKKLPSLEERIYAPYYRGYVEKLREYPRLGELRRFHMKPLLEEYTKRYPQRASVNEEEIERFSDGE